MSVRPRKFIYKIVKLDVTGDKIPDGDLIIQYNTKTGIEKYKYVPFKVIEEKVIKPAFIKATKKTKAGALPAGFLQTPRGRIFRKDDVNKQQQYALDLQGKLYPIETFNQNKQNPNFQNMQQNGQQLYIGDNTGFVQSFKNTAGEMAAVGVGGAILGGLDALFSGN